MDALVWLGFWFLVIFHPLAIAAIMLIALPFYLYSKWYSKWYYRDHHKGPMWEGIRDLTPAQRKKEVAAYQAYLNKSAKA